MGALSTPSCIPSAELESLQHLIELVPQDPTALNAGIRLLRDGEDSLAQRYFEAKLVKTQRAS
jgi:hypothetical protein